MKSMRKSGEWPRSQVGRAIHVLPMGIQTALGLSVLLALYATSLHSYLLFHTLTEVFTVVVASGAFMIAWNARRVLDNHYLLLLGIAFLFIGGLDLVHAISYKGMGVMPGGSANLPTQLWIAVIGMQSVSLFIAPLFVDRPLRPSRALLSYALVTTLLLLSIFRWQIFPACYVDVEGLTTFKTTSEYVFSGLLAASAFLLYRKRVSFDTRVLHLILSSIVLAIGAEIAFSFYMDVYGRFNLIGHLFRILSFYLIYKALIETGLTKPFTILFRNLKRSEEALRESEARYRSLFNGMISGFASHEIIFDENGKPKDYRILNVNPAFEQLTGLREEQVVGKSVLEVFPEIEPGWIDAYGRVAGGERSIRYEGFSGPLGKYFEVFVFSPGPKEFAITFNDITSRKLAELALQEAHDELELRVQERTAELLKINRDLQEFVFVASHDLQEPLRKIQAFADVLKNRHVDSLNEKSADYLSRMQGSAARMQNLIRALLAYSRVTSKESRFVHVDLRGLLGSINDDMEGRLRETGGRIEVGDLSPVQGDPNLLRQLFQNLIENALKFRGSEPILVRIHGQILQEDQREVYRIVVEDNGIGFEEKYLDRIFKPFQRLHAPLEYEGTGMGLAICRKIVERHGGDITAESTPGAGASFILTLPMTWVDSGETGAAAPNTEGRPVAQARSGGDRPDGEPTGKRDPGAKEDLHCGDEEHNLK